MGSRLTADLAAEALGAVIPQGTGITATERSNDRVTVSFPALRDEPGAYETDVHVFQLMQLADPETSKVPHFHKLSPTDRGRILRKASAEYGWNWDIAHHDGKWSVDIDVPATSAMKITGRLIRLGKNGPWS